MDGMLISAENAVSEERYRSAVRSAIALKTIDIIMPCANTWKQPGAAVRWSRRFAGGDMLERWRMPLDAVKNVVTGKTKSLHFGKPQHRPRTWSI